jgi:acetylornithine aminotransferase/acetylornithine/N-succinyldiaminopimelate aminotransferase
LIALQERHPSITDVRGLGLMLGVELDSADLAKAVVRALLNEGIIINRTHETVLRFLPPYIVQKKEIDRVVKALDGAISETSASAVTPAARHSKESA